MIGSSRQAYLEKARATLAAREAWQSVFAPATQSISNGGPHPADLPNQASQPGDEVVANDAERRCDQSDKSPAAVYYDEEVAWRAAAMRGQVPRTGTIPILLARPEARGSPSGTCLSCGDQLNAGQ